LGAKPASSLVACGATSAATKYAGAKQDIFPFTAIVGQDEMKLSLILNVVDPAIGGVVIIGDRGTAKSLAVSALGNLLPEIDVITDDPFNSSPTDANLQGPEAQAMVRAGGAIPVSKMRIPIVELPLGATEDRVVGTIDIERALTEGVKSFQPGLLARANRGILYVDEVNLLEDHLVDCVLDSAAQKWNYVEREGVSIQHPANFILVGSGNSAEGEMRPQLLDRFGHHATCSTIQDPDSRVELVVRCNAYAEDRAAFCEKFADEESELREKVRAARELLPSVTMDRDLKVMISDLCSRARVDGIRGDLVIVRSALAMAAYNGRNVATMEDVESVIVMCLWHRMRKDPMDPMGGSMAAMKIRGIWKAVKEGRE